MNDNSKFRLVAFLLSLNSFLFIAALFAVFSRFSRSDLNDYLSSYKDVVSSNCVLQTEYISNLTSRASSIIMTLKESARASRVPSVYQSSGFRSGVNLVNNLVNSNDTTCCKYLSSSNYVFAVAYGCKYFTYRGFPFEVGDTFFDGGKIIDFDNFAIKTDVAVYNLLEL